MKKAYTLVELMIAVIILAVLVVAAMPYYTKLFDRIKWTESLINLAAIRQGALLYRNLNGVNLGSFHDIDVTIEGVVRAGSPNLLDSKNFTYSLFQGPGQIWEDVGICRVFRDTDGDGAYDAGEPEIIIFPDGRFESYNGAPKF